MKNVSFATVFLIQNFHTNNFSDYLPANRYLVGFIFLPLKYPINFFLNLLGTGFLYLLDIMMNSSVMSVQHLFCHLDLN